MPLSPGAGGVMYFALAKDGSVVWTASMDGQVPSQEKIEEFKVLLGVSEDPHWFDPTKIRRQKM